MKNDYRLVLSYDEYYRQLDNFENFEGTMYYPTEEDMQLMERICCREVVLFACCLEDKLNPQTAGEKYSLKLVRDFVKNHLDLTE